MNFQIKKKCGPINLLRKGRGIYFARALVVERAIQPQSFSSKNKAIKTKMCRKGGACKGATGAVSAGCGVGGSVSAPPLPCSAAMLSDRPGRWVSLSCPGQGPSSHAALAAALHPAKPTALWNAGLYHPSGCPEEEEAAVIPVPFDFARCIHCFVLRSFITNAYCAWKLIFSAIPGTALLGFPNSQPKAWLT